MPGLSAKQREKEREREEKKKKKVPGVLEARPRGRRKESEGARNI